MEIPAKTDWNPPPVAKFLWYSEKQEVVGIL